MVSILRLYNVPTEYGLSSMKINALQGAALHYSWNLNILYRSPYPGTCHHGVARLRIAEGGDVLQIWE